MNNATDQIGYADFVDWRRVRTHLILNRWWILACMIVTAAVFSAVAFLARPTYRVTAVLMPTTNGRGMNVSGLTSGSLASLASGLGIEGSLNPQTEEALAVLESREFTEKFIVDENLLPQLFSQKWNESTHLWNVPPDQQPTLAEGYTYFDGKIRTIKEDRQTGLVTLTIEWRNPKEAADWANELIRQLNQEMRTRAIDKADAALKFLNGQLQSTSTVEVRNALGYLIETQLKNRMIAQVTPEYSLQFVAPPVGSDGAKPVWPRKLLLLGLGPPVGLLIGILLTLFWQNGLREKA